MILAGSAYLFYENQKLNEERQRLLARLVLPPTDTESDKSVLPPPKPATTTTEIKEEEPVSSTTTTEVEVTTTLQAAVTTSLESTTTTAAAEEVEEEEVTTTTLPEAAAQTGVAESDRISVSDVNLVPLQSPKGIKVAYRLVNKSQEGKKITGYTFVLAKNDEMEKSVVEVFPNTAVVEEGQPVDHKKGVAFSIFQFKTIRGRIYTKDPIKEILILVYDHDGELLYSQSYPVPSA